MMTILFFVLVTLFLVICQTVVFQGSAWFPQSFDLVIIPVLFLSLTYTHQGVILAIILIGLVMDSISGVPFFFYTFSYLWIYLVVKVVKQLVFQRSVIFILIISLVSILIQQGLLLFCVFLDHGKAALSQMDFTLMFRQLMWGAVFIPSGIWGVHVVRDNYLVLIRQVRREFVRRYRD